MDTSRDVTISHVYDITLLMVVFLKCGMNGQKERDEYDSSTQNNAKIS